jgi:phosphoserine phosphatase RsbX
VLVAVADGLGHGPAAHEASSLFCTIVGLHADEALETIMGRASHAMAGTRGAAAALIRMDTGNDTLEYCGVGNIELRSVSEERVAPVNAPGIVGHRMHRLKTFDYPVVEGDLFVVFSDGISSRFHMEQYQELPVRHIAERLLSEHGKSHDDATCVAIRIEPEPPSLSEHYAPETRQGK